MLLPAITTTIKYMYKTDKIIENTLNVKCT